MALGAFLGGMVVGRSEFSNRAASEALPMRDAFAVLFFVSVGMLFDPNHLVAEPLLVAATVGVVLIGKPLAALLIVRWLRYPPKIALAVAVALSQIGEFSFILAGVGRALGVFSEAASNTVIAAALITITVNSMLYRLVGPAEAWMRRRRALWSWLDARTAGRETAPSPERAGPPSDLAHRAVIVGYGPVGRTVRRLLEENGIETTIIDLNVDTVRQLRESGARAVYGDASQVETLRAADVPSAGTLILSASAMQSSEMAIRLARELNPKIRIIARADYVREAPQLRAAGAEVVYAGEAEVALAVTEGVLRDLGATPDQIEQERERVRRDLAVADVPPAGVP